MKVAILLSHQSTGISLKHFQLINQVCSSVFSSLEIVTYQGKKPVFLDENEAKTEQPKNLEYIDYTQVDLVSHSYTGLVVPDGMGYYQIQDPDEIQCISDFIYSFAKFKSILFAYSRTYLFHRLWLRCVALDRTQNG